MATDDCLIVAFVYAVWVELRSCLNDDACGVGGKRSVSVIFSEFAVYSFDVTLSFFVFLACFAGVEFGVFLEWNGCAQGPGGFYFFSFMVY